MKLRIIMTVLAFIAGLIASNMLAGASDFSTPIYQGGFELPQSNGETEDSNLEMPKDRIEERQIIVRNDKVVLDIQDAQWSTFTPTKSMVPVIDEGANAIQIAPEQGCMDIKKGDIISYESDYADGIIIHRVIQVGEDREGKYFIAKGDNNPTVDPGKIRCEQIKRVLVAIVY